MLDVEKEWARTTAALRRAIEKDPADLTVEEIGFLAAYAHLLCGIIAKHSAPEEEVNA